ncbi:hypothetical protein [Glycomyces terrestris]|uniref:Uncharacterized protein n=1 Tax=Glycomyces terrestris TaxID=2493553 RepID=A0A426V368_9ACTN|nr:hypothetical protein [Glycomyces terrestris]RRS01353.1 hypothetical protein EIW28_00820 [Glycomyces terrestris]
MDADVVEPRGVRRDAGEGPERGFGAMPAPGKAAAVLIWCQTGLLVLFLVLGRAGAAPTELALPDDLAMSLLAGAWTVLHGSFVFALSFALFWGRNWVRITLVGYYTLMMVRSAAAMIAADLSGSNFRDLALGAVMVWLLLTPAMRAWCRPVPPRPSLRR